MSEDGTAAEFKATCQALLDGYVAAYRLGDATGCAAIYHEQSALYSAFGPPVYGRAAIEALHEDWLAEDTSGKNITVVDAGQSGDMGWCVARFSDETESGTTLSVLTFTSGAGWLITQSSLTEG